MTFSKSAQSFVAAGSGADGRVEFRSDEERRTGRLADPPF
jgi:hypothetical protein